MKTFLPNPPAVVEVSKQQNRVEHLGLESGLNGLDWCVQLEPAVRAELELVYASRDCGVLKMHLDQSRDHLASLEITRETIFKQLGSFRKSAPIQNGAKMWSVRRALATACGLGLVGLLAVWCGVSMDGYGWSALVLVWTLVQIEPRFDQTLMAAPGLVVTCGATFLNTAKLALARRRIRRLECDLENEKLERERRKAIVNAQVHLLISHYHLARVRGAAARRITQANEREGENEQAYTTADFRRDSGPDEQERGVHADGNRGQDGEGGTEDIRPII